MTPTLVLNVVGLTKALLGEHTPHLSRLAADAVVAPIAAVTPAVTCSAQATYLTGVLPSEHGIVGNGWYFRELCEVWFWRQSNRLIEAPKVWELAKQRDPAFTVANLFWWYNMYSTADWSVTPRPMYPADGRKLPDVYTQPGDLRDELNRKFGTFPLFRFWGPAADIASSRWITDAALHVLREKAPTLCLVYLPHLDYNLQRLGPDLSHPKIQSDIREVDALCGELIDTAKDSGRQVIVMSEYGITEVRDAVHINRALRQAGWLKTRLEMGRELLDAGASAAFAVADHQLAHVYINTPAVAEDVRRLIANLDGVQTILGEEEKREVGLAHERAGDLVAISDPDRWFTYYWWLDDRHAPDFAPTVDIHRKPGYDPVELFINPELRFPKLAVGWRLLKKRLGLRTLMDVISTSQVALVKGSHGRPTDDPSLGPVLIAPPICAPALDARGLVPATAIRDVMLRAVFDGA